MKAHKGSKQFPDTLGVDVKSCSAAGWTTRSTRSPHFRGSETERKRVTAASPEGVACGTERVTVSRIAVSNPETMTRKTHKEA